MTTISGTIAQANSAVSQAMQHLRATNAQIAAGGGQVQQVNQQQQQPQYPPYYQYPQYPPPPWGAPGAGQYPVYNQPYGYQAFQPPPQGYPGYGSQMGYPTGPSYGGGGQVNYYVQNNGANSQWSQPYSGPQYGAPQYPGPQYPGPMPTGPVAYQGGPQYPGPMPTGPIAYQGGPQYPGPMPTRPQYPGPMPTGPLPPNGNPGPFPPNPIAVLNSQPLPMPYQSLGDVYSMPYNPGFGGVGVVPYGASVPQRPVYVIELANFYNPILGSATLPIAGGRLDPLSIMGLSATNSNFVQQQMMQSALQDAYLAGLQQGSMGQDQAYAAGVYDAAQAAFMDVELMQQELSAAMYDMAMQLYGVTGQFSPVYSGFFEPFSIDQLLTDFTQNI